MLEAVSFTVAQAFELRRITRERDRADRITTFMTDMFKVSNPSVARSRATKDPELQAQMMHTMSNVYDNLGLYPQARSLATRAVDIRRRVLGPQNPNTLASINSLGWILGEHGHFAEAERLGREAQFMLALRSLHLRHTTGRWSPSGRRVTGSHPSTIELVGAKS